VCAVCASVSEWVCTSKCECVGIVCKGVGGVGLGL